MESNSSSSDLKISFCPVVNDFFYPSFWILFHAKRIIWFFVFAVFLTLFFAVRFYFTETNSSDGGNLVSILGWAFGLPFWVFVVWPALTYFRIKRLLAAPKFSNGIIYTFQENGIHIQMATESHLFMWGTLTEVVEKKDFIAFLRSSTVAEILPKRAFDDPAKLTALRKILRSKCGTKARLEIL